MVPGTFLPVSRSGPDTEFLPNKQLAYTGVTESTSDYAIQRSVQKRDLFSQYEILRDKA
jgi:hypothetical protein